MAFLIRARAIYFLNLELEPSDFVFRRFLAEKLEYFL
jgi:hypothetical protein